MLTSIHFGRVTTQPQEEHKRGVQELGATSLKVTSVTYGDTTAQVNLQGPAATGGTVKVTLTLKSEPGATSGSVSGRGARFMDDGTILNIVGEGAWTTVGKHKWRIRQMNCASNGMIVLTDGELDLATLSLNYKAHEWS
jgi:hypothetical protein